MPDYSNDRVPRPVIVNRDVRLGQRRSANRAVLLAVGGLAVLCVCLLIGVVGLASALGIGPFANSGATAFSLPFGSSAATAVPTDSGKPTPVPLGKTGKNDAGLRVTVATYQRPLPAQDVQIPPGQELALVSVKLDNTRTTGGPIKYAPEDFKLVSPEGEEYSAVASGITTGEILKKGEVAPGKSVKGDLIFYVYSDNKDLQLAWTSADGSTRLFKVTR